MHLISRLKCVKCPQFWCVIKSYLKYTGPNRFEMNCCADNGNHFNKTLSHAKTLIKG